MTNLRFGFCAVTIALAASTFAMAPSAALAQAPSMQAAVVAETAPVPADKVPGPITAAVNAPGRPADDRALDAGRKPAQILAFFGIAPGMKVADLFAGGGYFTELLSHVVGPNGTVYSQNAPFPDKYKKIGDAWRERLKKPDLSNVVAVNKPFDAPDLLPVAPGSLDAVLININYHDLVGFKLHPENVNAAVFKALKPGGIYGIVDHSAKKGTGASDASTLHRIDEDYVISDVEKGGFKLAARSSALRHPEDDRTWLVFKKRGQTDRFMLKFVKPK